MINLVILDWDDTVLLGSKKAILKCYDTALRSVHIQLPAQKIANIERENAGKGVAVTLKLLLQEHPEKFADALQAMEAIYHGDFFVKNTTVLPQTPKLLQQLASNYDLAITTGENRKVLESTMREFSIPLVFKEIICSEEIIDLQKRKPHPYSIEQLLKKTKYAAAQTVMVGDSENDIVMGKSAGTKTIAVLTGHLTIQTAKELGADIIIDDIRMLESALKKL